MSKIVCTLFGVPQITKDGQSVFLPYAKINALLYYMLVSKVVSRDEIVGLLWPDEEEKTAKKNLRNAIYQAKKSLGEDIILSPKKSFLILNEELDIQCDIDLFLSQPQEHLDLYAGEFLQGFFLKDAESYEYWITKMRNFYREKFSCECYAKIQEDIRAQRFEVVEANIKRLIELDEYDERNFRLLMRFYQETGRNSKVIETYYDLAKFLRRELGIDPDKKTREIYERALEQISVDGSKASRDEGFFFGRYSEIAAMERVLKDFREGRSGSSLLITGEPGVGKSTILRRLLEEVPDSMLVLESACHQPQCQLSLRPWRSIAQAVHRQLEQTGLIQPQLWRDLMVRVFPDFDTLAPDPQFMEGGPAPLTPLVQVIVEGLSRLARERQVVLVFEDLQWMDPDSLSLLISIMLECDPLRIMLVTTSSRERNLPLESALTALGRSQHLVVIPLERFNAEACHHLLEEALPGRQLKGKTLEHIYNETEGNPFFLSEYITLLKNDQPLDQLSLPMRQALDSRFLTLSPQQREVADLVAYFNDEASFSILLQLSEKSEGELLQLLEGLKDRDILAERDLGGDCLIRFTHIKLREFAYQAQSPARKRVVHQRIGLLLQAGLDEKKPDTKLYSKLIYHFSAAGDYLKALTYRIASLNSCLNFSHEMFPVLDNLELEAETNLYISREQIDELFRNLESSFAQVQGSTTPSAELDLLEVEFFYMKGRFLIREGEYDLGVDNIMYVIDRSRQMNVWNYTLEGYKQMILYYLQINDPAGMGEYVELALELAVRCNYHKEIGIILRLKGLSTMMSGNYTLAEKLLTESINTLAVTETVAKRYAANIAAAYAYIGEIRQAQERYDQALELFDKAIALCQGKNTLASLSYFYINAGKTAYYMENISLARSYFEQAYSLYGEFDSFWRRSVLDSYMALTLIRQEDYQQALRYLLTARENLGHIKDPNDQGVVLFAQALIRKMADEDPRLRQVFQDTLTQPASFYCRQALEQLNPYCNRYEATLLSAMLSSSPPSGET